MTIDDLQALASVFYNLSAYDVARAVHGADSAEFYLEEKAEMMLARPFVWIGSLDDDHLQALADLCNTRGR